jgi:hypothetical protein
MSAAEPAVPITVDTVRAEALALLDGVPDREDLDLVTEALITLVVHACVTTLDPAGTEEHTRRALDAGATVQQVHEAIVLVSWPGPSRCPGSKGRTVSASDRTRRATACTSGSSGSSCGQSR